jgi:cytochrome c-type biogenesis protein CcmE
MTRKNRRLLVVLACAIGLGSATALTLSAFNSTLELFVAPSKLATDAPKGGRAFRLGGLVEGGSVERIVAGGQPTARFRISDGAAAVAVEYVGILPDLFREGQGVVTLGVLRPDGVFKAQEVLAKHDETYMPKDVADALKKSGKWRPEAGAPPAAALWNDPNTAKKTGS